MPDKENKISVIIAVAALVVSVVSAYFSRSGLDVSENSARAELFSNFQQHYNAIASQFPPQHFDKSWRPATGSDEWLRLKRYWDLCYVEWYATKKLHPALYGSLWDNFYSQAISDALEYPSLRGVLIDMMTQQRDTAPHKQEFYQILRSLAQVRGVSLEPDRRP